MPGSVNSVRISPRSWKSCPLVCAVKGLSLMKNHDPVGHLFLQNNFPVWTDWSLVFSYVRVNYFSMVGNTFHDYIFLWHALKKLISEHHQKSRPSKTTVIASLRYIQDVSKNNTAAKSISHHREINAANVGENQRSIRSHRKNIL